jgi:septal ring-binding cell division protein DamX
MAAPSVRDFDRNLGKWQDRLELRLDNRQVFFLFFGSAVVACMLFVLGVMVGKRIESRGQADAAPVTDPLAALDRARQPPPGVAAPAELSFPNRLIKAPAPVAAPKPAKAAAPKLAKVAPAPPPPAPAAPKPLAAAPAAAPKPVAAAPKPVAAAPKPVAAAPKPVAAAPKPLAAAPKPLAAAPKTIAAPVAIAEAAKPAKGKYTLQLSTFATAADAATFAGNYPGAFVISGDVPGKGNVFRVRYGNFASYTEATAAKESFEKQHNMIALIAAR